MSSQTPAQTATALYEQVRERNARTAGALGATWTPRGIYAATYEQLLAHCVACADLEARYRCRMDPVALWGQTPEQLAATALHKARVLAGKRGKKVLVERYGERIAAEIIGR